MTTFTVQPDASAGIDGFNNEASPSGTGTTGASLNTQPAAAGARRFAFIKFDVSSIPAGVTVSSATLYLYNATVVAGTRAFAVNSVLAANSGWVEGLSWDYANPSTVRWAGDTGADGGSDAGGSVSGTDWNATALGTFNYAASDPADTEYAVTLNTSQVEAWINGANYGLVLRRTDATAALFAFRSSDYTTDITKRPKLVIDYTVAGGDVAARTIIIGAPGIQLQSAGGAGIMNIN